MKIFFSISPRLVLVVLFCFGSNALMAQIPEYYETSVVNFTPQFFVCLIAGVLLAIGFQVLLTTLSVASGISAIGNIDKKSRGSKSSNQHNEKDDDDTPTIVKISSAIGIWTVITVSVSLFFASLFAVKLSLLSDNIIGVTLGLVIWAAFFTIMMYLEVKSVSSLLGGIVNTSLAGIRSTFSTVGGMLGSSKEARMKNVAKESISSIREEIADALDNSKINQKMDEYVNKLESKQLDYKRAKEELKQLLKDIQLEERSEVGDEGIERKTFIKLAEEQPNFSKEDVKKLGNLYDEIKGIAKSEGSPGDKVLKAVDKFTPGTEEDTKKYRSKLEEYLRATGKEELNPDNLKRDLETIFNDPSQSKDIIRNRINQLDKNTLVSVISQRKDVSEEDARKITGYFEKAFDFVKNKFSGNGGADEGRPGSKDNLGYAGGTESSTSQEPGIHIIRKSDNNGHGNSAGFEDKIRNYFNSLKRPEFNYDGLKRDFEQIFHDPKSTFSVLKNRLGQYDRKSLVALLSSRENVSKRDAERMVDKVEEARENVLSKAEKVEGQVKDKLRQIKEATLHEAENARKAAAAAAWWLFATAVVSGVASVVGGMMAITI